MTTEAAPAGKKPRGGWAEINRFYERANRPAALRYGERFFDLLTKNADGHDSIFGEECWSLLFELRKDLHEAVKHKEHEIELIQQLWEVSANTPGMTVVLRTYGIGDLADRLDLLAILYHDAGRLDTAILTLMRSKWLCESFKVAFESENLLQDYLYEKNIDSGLMRALQKQGWKLSEHSRGASGTLVGPPAGVRPTRRGVRAPKG